MIVSAQDVYNKFFDYVIVGGGTSGLTLAARLSEDPSVSVLVLEAGAANINDPNILRPASFGSHFGQSAYDWSHQTTKQNAAGDHQFPWPRGKGLGGSSGINFLCWLKPHADEIDDIEKLGNPGWNWSNYQKYVGRTEGFVPPAEDFQIRNNMNFDAWKIGRDGPLTLAYPATIAMGELKVQQTLKNAGIPTAHNPLSGDPTGVFFTPNTYDPKTHTRTYSTSAFYLPNKERTNLSVLPSAYVNRILTEASLGGNLCAVGVEFQCEGQACIANAKKEVILSAGALKSPQVLEMSGIGNEQVLRKIGIPMKVDLPGVGSNVQEHMFAGVSWELRDDVDFDTPDLLRDPALAAKHMALHADGTGLFTTGVVGFSFTPLSMMSGKAYEIGQSAKENIRKNADSYPPGLIEQYEIQLERLERGAPGCELISFPGLLSGPNPPADGKRYISFLVAMNHCFSRGTIHSTSNDPSKDPEFNPRYLDEDVDLQTWMEMIKFARGLGEVAPLKDMISKEFNPGVEVQGDVQITDWLKKHITSTWHTAGSCSMLPRDKGGVVDPNLKVYGTNNVRVVDLSIIPLHFAAHPQATVYAIAEQAADIIKGRMVDGIAF